MVRPQRSMPGTWYGAPVVYGGQGSMAGPKAVNIPTSPASGRTAWSPTTANLVVLVALEIVVYCGLRYLFRTAHGG